jgi:hypothetical protein
MPAFLFNARMVVFQCLSSRPKPHLSATVLDSGNHVETSVPNKLRLLPHPRTTTSETGKTAPVDDEDAATASA